MSNTTKRFLMAASGGKKSTYVDDVFSTLLWSGEFTGNAGTTRQMTNGIDLAGEGGLVWIKQRNQAYSTGHQLYDTVRGAGAEKELDSSSTAIQGAGNIETYGWLNSFDAGGFTTKGGSTDSDYVNQTGVNYTGWTFRKAKGFCDIVTYTGTGSARTISHSLGSVPGCMIIKCTNQSRDWTIYHQGVDSTGNNPEHYRLKFTTAAIQTNSSYWNSTKPTSTHFSLGSSNQVNETGDTYVAYIFAGGASSAATARSVDFDGSADYMVSTDSSYQPGTGDFTIECWVKHDALAMKGIFQLSGSSVFNGTNGIAVLFNTNSGNKRWELYAGGATTQESVSYSGYTTGVWAHLAVVKTGGKTKLYVDGTESISVTDTTNYSTESYLGLGGAFGTQYTFNGQISNFKYTKGQALYTSSFRPPTEPLTTTSQGSTASNVKALCCQSSSATSATVIASALSITGSVTASTDSPFDDPEGFKFGEEGDKNIIKCGSYTGNGNSNGPEVYLGWEPQWLLLKNTNLSTEQWFIFDSMRGIISNGTDYVLEPSRNVQEAGWDLIDLTPTGFKIKINDDKVNNNGGNYVYVAIRRPDGYVGKPAEAGTDVFAMDVGNGSSTIPSHDSGFPVDFAFVKRFASTGDWDTSARLIQEKFVKTNTNAAETTSTGYTFDSNVGWGSASWLDSAVQSWMWKRGQGMDVVCYTGNGTSGHSINHSLGKSPEIIWVKNRTSGSNTGDWMVGFKDLYGGSSPWNGYLVLNKSQAQYNDNHPFNNYTPTAIDFQLNNWDRVNANGSNYIAMLFTSVDGISSCGSYAPSSSSTTVTCGFQPRFVIVKAITKDNTWSVADSLRGITAGNDPALALNENWENDKYGGADWIDVSATGFTVNSTGSGTADANSNGETYIYYAHA